MGRNLLEVLIPARFMLTMGHLVSLLMIFYTKKENILAGLPSDPGKSRYDEAKYEVPSGFSDSIDELTVIRSLKQRTSFASSVWSSI